MQISSFLFLGFPLQFKFVFVKNSNNKEKFWIESKKYIKTFVNLENQIKSKKRFARPRFLCKKGFTKSQKI